MKKLLTLFLSIILAFGTIGLVGCGETETAEENNAYKEEYAVQRKISSDLTVQKVSLFSGTVLKRFSDPDIEASPSVSKVITATVLPEDAIDKSLHWEIFWLSTDIDNPVTDYVQITPSNDTLSCTVTAYQGFEGSSIQIKATSNASGVFALCAVEYDGKPENLYINYNGNKLSNNDTSLDNRIDLISGTTYSFDLSFGNTLNNIGSNYDLNNLTCTLNGSGNFLATRTTYARSQSPVVETDINVSVDNYVNYFVEAEISEGKLIIKVKKPISSYYILSQSSNGAVELVYSGLHPLGSPCFYVNVRDTISGVYNSLYFNIIANVSSVALSENKLTF